MKNNEFAHNDLCVGIDLGTTNSVLATINTKLNGDIISKVVNIPRATNMYNTATGDPKLTSRKDPTLPSCVFYRQERNYEPLVGDFAKTQYPLRTSLVAKSIKSQMGNSEVVGLADDVPDKTPAEVASRILQHMIRETEKIYRCKITDAVITVPANFDPVMCKATRDAAELAGIKVRNEDGSERPVLLSEPNAVVYDLINQIRNGEIPSGILDLSQKKRVLVFDLGGGTLDITMHEIKRSDKDEEVIKVDEISTNRYTLLGGDDFDEKIAEVMYESYLAQYSKHPEIVNELRKEKAVIMSQMRIYAEQLKLDLNEQCGEGYDLDSFGDSIWEDGEDEEVVIPVGGTMGGLGYAFDGSFSQKQIEDILSCFMATELTYEDYKKIDNITNTRNIIFPILDVLHKASEKLGEENVVVDAVIVNGGMSKFYMVTDRLKEFFGFEPIVALDPDQSVARGAAVYHHYMHKYQELEEYMKMIKDDENENGETKSQGNGRHSHEKYSGQVLAQQPHITIEWENNILNDCLYLGVRNGAVHPIVPTGTELPYTSEVMTGFKIEPNQKRITIPIKSRNLDGTYRTIATGDIVFKQQYRNGAYVAFKVHMERNKVITMTSWTSKDESGKEKIEQGSAEISVYSGEKSGTKNKCLAPSGTKLNPKAEINNLLQLCDNFQKKNPTNRSNISKRIKEHVSAICNAGNVEDFAEEILNALSEGKNLEAKMRLFTIARKTCGTWTDSQKNRLGSRCMTQLSGSMHGFSVSGPETNVNIQAVYTLAVCGKPEQLKKLSALHDYSKYLQCCMYAHAKTRTELIWIQEQFFNDVNQVCKSRGSNIQFSAYAIGISLKKDEIQYPHDLNEDNIMKKLCRVIESGNLKGEELVCCILALGWIGDQRQGETEVGSGVIRQAIRVIEAVASYYPVSFIAMAVRPISVALKMLRGETLDEDEEKFLLTKLEI